LGVRRGRVTLCFCCAFRFFFVAYYYGTNGLLDTIIMEGASVSTNPRTVEEVFKDFKGRRAGMLKALTSGNVGLHVVFVVCCLLYMFVLKPAYMFSARIDGSPSLAIGDTSRSLLFLLRFSWLQHNTARAENCNRYAVSRSSSTSMT
jgi:hypothetical protein